MDQNKGFLPVLYSTVFGIYSMEEVYGRSCNFRDMQRIKNNNINDIICSFKIVNLARPFYSNLTVDTQRRQ